MIKGTTNVWRFRSCGELSTWIRYTSDGDSGSTNVFRESGIRVNGGSGPDSDRGVDASDDAFDAIVFVLPARRADFAMLSVCPSLPSLGSVACFCQAYGFSSPESSRSRYSSGLYILRTSQYHRSVN